MGVEADERDDDPASEKESILDPTVESGPAMAELVGDDLGGADVEEGSRCNGLENCGCGVDVEVRDSDTDANADGCNGGKEEEEGKRPRHNHLVSHKRRAQRESGKRLVGDDGDEKGVELGFLLCNAECKSREQRVDPQRSQQHVGCNARHVVLLLAVAVAVAAAVGLVGAGGGDGRGDVGGALGVRGHHLFMQPTEIQEQNLFEKHDQEIPDQGEELQDGVGHALGFVAYADTRLNGTVALIFFEELDSLGVNMRDRHGQEDAAAKGIPIRQVFLHSRVRLELVAERERDQAGEAGEEQEDNEPALHRLQVHILVVVGVSGMGIGVAFYLCVRAVHLHACDGLLSNGDLGCTQRHRGPKTGHRCSSVAVIVPLM
mmetsp:Transcript_52757/g.114558  ORF Transcript_52757/g.114558 Transcript_52757/m.114558 type:complete len:375 (-) Transcript_52757:454-1578(-)